MSVRIKISYTEEEELAGILWILSRVMKSYKIQPAKGKYKRAYIRAKERFYLECEQRGNSERTPGERREKVK